jgi:Xaa-Pro aminopeptidase
MDYRGRMARAQEAMRAQGLDWLLVAASADLTYLTGLRMQPGDRLTALLLPATGESTLLVPTMEAAALDQFALPSPLLTWPDGTDSLALIVERMSGARTVGVSESLWARDLLPLLERLPGTHVATATPVLQPLRLIKDEAEIDLLRHAAHAADRVFARITSVGLEGRTEIEVAGMLSDLLVDEGHDAPAFTIVASGPHGAAPHHEPDRRRLAHGDLVVLDFGGTIEGYYSDITRTLAVGEPDAEMRAAYEAVRAAQEIGVQAVQPGTPTGAVDRATRSALERAGYGPYFVHRTGHGLGLEVHEPPYLVSGDETVLQPGMVFSVEPGVYLPGRFGVRIEDIVVVTPHGVERLNTADRALRVVD